MEQYSESLRNQSGRPAGLDKFLFGVDDCLYDNIKPQSTNEIYFTASVGQAGKTYTDTNLTASQQIPFSENFWVTGIAAAILENYQVFPTASLSAKDCWAALEQMLRGNWTLKIGKVSELQANLKSIMNYLEFAVISPDASASADTIYNSLGCVFGKTIGYRKFTDPFLLTPKFNFNVEVEWDAIPTYATNPFTMGIYLVGKRIRVAQ